MLIVQDPSNFGEFRIEQITDINKKHNQIEMEYQAVISLQGRVHTHSLVLNSASYLCSCFQMYISDKRVKLKHGEQISCESNTPVIVAYYIFW